MVVVVCCVGGQGLAANLGLATKLGDLEGFGRWEFECGLLLAWSVVSRSLRQERRSIGARWYSW